MATGLAPPLPSTSATANCFCIVAISSLDIARTCAKENPRATHASGDPRHCRSRLPIAFEPRRRKSKQQSPFIRAPPALADSPFRRATVTNTLLLPLRDIGPLVYDRTPNPDTCQELCAHADDFDTEEQGDDRRELIEMVNRHGCQIHAGSRGRICCDALAETFLSETFATSAGMTVPMHMPTQPCTENLACLHSYGPYSYGLYSL